jgi:zinc D-Ala-D-Ala dipeptidase
MKLMMQPRVSGLMLAAALVAAGCTPPGVVQPRQPVEAADPSIASNALAESLLVDVTTLAPTVRVEMRYATTSNFTGEILPGYEANRALLRREAASALARVQERLARDGLGLKVFDAYRPVRATRAMLDWTRREGRENLVTDGYIASRSRHNLGAAIDVTLINLSTGRELPMGTEFDTFSAAAHTANASGQVARNRATLVRRMAEEGWSNYEKEWWHFSFPVPRELRFDMVIR